jgi:hypothetical protein
MAHLKSLKQVNTPSSLGISPGADGDCLTSR